MQILGKYISHRSANNIIEKQQYCTSFYQRLFMKPPYCNTGVDNLNIIKNDRFLNGDWKEKLILKFFCNKKRIPMYC